MVGAGRPSEGVRVEARIPEDVLAAIDDEAQQRGITRAAMIREILRRNADLGSRKR